MFEGLFSSGTILFICPVVALILATLLTIFLPKIKVAPLRILIGFMFFTIGVFTTGLIVFFKQVLMGQYTMAIILAGFAGGALLTFFTEKTSSKVMAVIVRALFFFLAWLFICIYVVLVTAQKIEN